MGKKIKSYFCAVILIVIFVCFDQFTKILAVSHLKDQPDIPIIKNVFELMYLENRGAAFGMFQNQKIAFLIGGIIVLAVAAVIYGRIPSDRKFLWFKFSLIWLCAGAIGNMIDRTIHTYVVDFFYFKLIDFPVFNVADIYVTVGCALLVILILFVYKDHELDPIFTFRKAKS